MAYKYEDNSSNGSDLLWDLRMYYAFYVSRYLSNFAQSREQNNYPKMINELKWLFYTIRPRVKKEYSEKNFEDDYNNIVKISNKYKDDWTGKKRTSEGITEIEESILILYSNLMEAMIDAGIFGKGEDLSGL